VSIPLTSMTQLLIPALLLVLIGVVAYSRLPAALKLLLILGLAFRLVGAGTRHFVLFELYDGVGDAVLYYDVGSCYAEAFSRLDFSLSGCADGDAGERIGTRFVYIPTGIVLAVFGPGILGAAAAFSLLAFVGLLGFLRAFSNSYPGVPLANYARWLCLFPALWFWPSMIGKEAIVLFGVGVAIAGFAWKKDRTQWLLLLSGVAIVYMIRPQVAALLLFSLGIGQWAALQREWRPSNILQGVGAGLATITVIVLASQQLGMGSLDLESLQGYVESDPARRVGGGSAIEAVQFSIGGLPLAAMNILFRPFPWEVRNPMMLISSIEIWTLWAAIIWKRRDVVATLRRVPQDRLLAAALVFCVLYAVSLGVMLTNLGIVARQRVLLFPFVFLLLEATVRTWANRKGKAASPPVPVHDEHHAEAIV
jgi:hypothetical protein